MIEIKSWTRCVRLDTPPPEGIAWQLLLVPDGSHDTDVLGWAKELLAPDAAAELAARLGLDGNDGDPAATS